MTTATYKRFDASLLFSVDDLIAQSEAEFAVASEAAAPVANPYQAEVDAHEKNEARREACLNACYLLSTRAHTFSKTCPSSVRDALFRVLDRWYRLSGVVPFVPRRAR